MASEESAQNDEMDEGQGSKKGKKLILIIVGLLLLIGIGGAGAYFSGMLGGKKEEATKEEGGALHDTKDAKGAKKDGAGATAKQGDPVFYELPEFINNLNTGSTQSSFIKASVILEVASQEDLKRVQEMQPRIIDDVNTYMRELRASDLGGSSGLERLREELLRRINKAVSPSVVNNVLFKEVIVQ